MKESKLSITVKVLAIILILTLLLGSLGLGFYFMKKNEILEQIMEKVEQQTENGSQSEPETPTEEDDQPVTEVTEPTLSFTSFTESVGLKLAPMNAAGDRGVTGLTKTLVATVLPSTARNKAVDWSIVWADANNTANISQYLTVTPESNGSTTATVTCTQAFTGNAVVIVTTRESGYTAECVVTYVGVPTDMSVSCDGITISNNACALGVGQTYAFNVAPTNSLGAVGTNYQNVNVTLDAVGSVVLGNYTIYSDGSEEWSSTADHTVTVQSLIDNFIEVSYSNGVATVTTKKTIESYYEYLTRMDGGRTKLYTNKYHSSVGECYFRLTVTEPVSHVTKTIKITFDSTIVTSVNLSPSEISF